MTKHKRTVRSNGESRDKQQKRQKHWIHVNVFFVFVLFPMTCFNCRTFTTQIEFSTFSMIVWTLKFYY